MNLPKQVIWIDVGKGNDFTVSIAVKLEANKDNLSVDITILESNLLDTRKMTEKEKRILITGEELRLKHKYNIE